MDPASKKLKAGLPVFIALLCFLPVLFATVFYYAGYRFDSLGKTNYGVFVDPAQSLSQLKLRHPNGSPFLIDELDGRWALFWVMPESCDQACQEKVLQIQQIQIALGKYQDRLLKFVLVSERTALPLPGKYNIQSQAVLIRQDSPIFWIPQQLYLIDPQGNIVLFYKPGFEGKKVLGDVRHLIKLSTAAR